MLKRNDVKKGQRVVYIPSHANGDRNHEDSQGGVIKRWTDDGEDAFVIYDNLDCRMLTGDEPYTAARTKLCDLIAS